jgi:hypothetical protein
MFLEVTKAEYQSDYKIKLWFNDGKVKIVDLSDKLNGSAFECLKKIENFTRFSVRFNTIEWYNGADLAPEYLYSIGVAA